MKIAIIDSGLGGLDIFDKIITKYPCHQYLYLADNLCCPYGIKDSKTINFLTSKIIKYLKQLKIDIIIMACNTMSANYVETDEEIKIYKILQYNAQTIKSLKVNKLAIIATASTIRSQIYNELLQRVDIRYINGSILTKLIEDDSEKKDLEREIKTLVKLCHGCDHVLLGCTHYALHKNIFLNRDNSIIFVDGSHQLVNDLPLSENKEAFQVDVALTRLDEEYVKRIRTILHNCPFSVHKVKL